MKNKRMSFKRLLFTFMVMVCLCVPSSIVFAQTDKEMTQEADKGVPEVRFTGDVNGHEEFKFVPVARTTQEPTSKWSWSDGKYYVDGSSNYSTLYTNYYFTSVKGKKFRTISGNPRQFNYRDESVGLCVSAQKYNNKNLFLISPDSCICFRKKAGQICVENQEHFVL